MNPEDRPRRLSLFLCGDVMLGRGMDQVMASSVDPGLRERAVRDARRYVELAERANGPVPAPVAPAYPWGDALDALAEAEPDLRIVNLETAVTAGGSPASGKAVHYRMHPDNVAVLTAADIDACVLANNHVLDWGRRGLETTLETLQGAGIRTVGAGWDRPDAEAPAALETETGRLLLFARASADAGVPEAWAAGPNRPGVALLPDLSEATGREMAARIRRERGPGDAVVVSLHWGANWGYRVPESHRRFARLLVDEGGADLVHGHSSHHPKGMEVRRGRPILYGCGDFLNDYEGIAGHEEVRPELVLLFLATLDPDGGPARLTMRPFRVRRFRLQSATPGEAEWLREVLDRESRRLGARVHRREDGSLDLRPG